MMRRYICALLVCVFVLTVLSVAFLQIRLYKLDPSIGISPHLLNAIVPESQQQQRGALSTLSGTLDSGLSKIRSDAPVVVRIKDDRKYADAQSSSHKNTSEVVRRDHANICKTCLLVHILSYQRTGSTFLGGFFHSNPDVFYIYEPIEMIYSPAVGAAEGWSAPADIFLNRNGTLRTIPQEEMDLMFYMMDNIYSCSLSELPTSVLLHPFWETLALKGWMPASRGYLECLLARGTRPSAVYEQCRFHIKDICPGRFDPMAQNFSKCMSSLYNKARWGAHSKQLKEIWDLSTAKMFMNYHFCINSQRSIVKICARNTMDHLCQKSQIRVIKTVRGTMDLSIKLLETYKTHMKVIHLLRNPVSVARSRVLMRFTHGIHERDSPGARAAPYCLSAARDLKNAEDVTDPRSNYLQVVYDSFVRNISREAHRIYSYLGITLNKKANHFTKREHSRSDKKLNIHNISQNKKKGEKSRWIPFKTESEQASIKLTCAPLYKLFKKFW